MTTSIRDALLERYQERWRAEEELEAREAMAAGKPVLRVFGSGAGLRGEFEW